MRRKRTTRSDASHSSPPALPYVAAVAPRSLAFELAHPEASLETFLTPEARALADARARHLQSLQMSWDGLRVLDVGSGPGLLAQHVTRLGAEVVCVDGREELLAAARRRIPGLQTARADVQRDPLVPLGRFDVVLAFGLLYHLAEPLRALRNIVATCDELLMLETITLDHSLPLLQLYDEPAWSNQALDGLACRPTPAWVAMALERIGMSAVYGIADEPDHPEYGAQASDTLETERDGHALRRTFVAARGPLDLPNLVAIVQTPSPRPAKIVLDVGAHDGETTLSLAATDPTVVVYAFEPLPGYAEALNRRLANYHAWPVAIAGNDGEAQLHVTRSPPGSSLRTMQPKVAGTYPAELRVEYDTVVTTRRLDSFCREHHIRHVDLLKIDAQGADLEALESLGEQLALVKRGVIQAQHAGADLYEETSGRAAVIAFLERSGFHITGELMQTEGREANIHFERTDSSATRSIAVGWETAEASGDAQLVARPDSLEIVTPPERWSYAALIPLPASESLPRAVRVKLVVHEGQIGFGLLRDISDAAVEFSLDAGRETTVDLPVLSRGDLWRLLVRNHSKPEPSRCTITEVAFIFAEDQPSSSRRAAP